MKKWSEIESTIAALKKDLAEQKTFAAEIRGNSAFSWRVRALTTAQRDTLYPTPFDSLLVYNTTLTLFQLYYNGAWHNIGTLGAIDHGADLTAASLLDDDHTQYNYSPVGKTGFPHGIETDVTLAFVDATRTFSITPVGADFNVWVGGVQYTFAVAQTVIITDTEGLWYIYFNAAGVLTASQTAWNLADNTVAPVCQLYWDAANNEAIYIGWECHHYTMSPAAHDWAHHCIGTLWNNGLAVSDGGAGTLTVTAGEIHDEDNSVEITDGAGGGLWEQDLSPVQIPIYYRLGATGLWRRVYNATSNTYYAYESGGGDVYWNQFVAGAWQLTAYGANEYGVYWILATPDIDEPVIAVMGQGASNNNVNDAIENNDLPNFAWGAFPADEFRILARIVVRNAGAPYTTTSIVDYRSANVIPSAGYVTTEHGSLSGLADNDHPQYVNAVGDTASLDLTLAAQSISGAVLPAGVDHDALLNFVANEHIDHTTVTLTAGAGLTGGGTIAANRTFDVGAGLGITVNADDVALKNAANLTDNCLPQWDDANGQFADSRFFDDGTNAYIDGHFAVGDSTLEAWNANYRALQVGPMAALWGEVTEAAGNALRLTYNLYYDGAVKRIINEEATMYRQSGGTHRFYTYVAGAADVDCGADIIEIAWFDTTGLKLLQDGTALSLGADSDVTLTHVHNTGMLVNSTRQLQFGDSGTHIAQLTDGHLDLTADTSIDLNATTTYVSGELDVDGNITVDGAGGVDITSGKLTQNHLTFSTEGPTDNVDVSGVNVLFIDCTSNSVTIGGFAGGVVGQVLYISVVVGDGAPNFFKLEQVEGGGSQDIYLPDVADMLFGQGNGIVLVCNGTSWFSCDFQEY